MPTLADSDVLGCRSSPLDSVNDSFTLLFSLYGPLDLPARYSALDLSLLAFLVDPRKFNVV